MAGSLLRMMVRDPTSNQADIGCNPGRETMAACGHLNELRPVTPHTAQGCEECLKTGDKWVHLRLCLQCGHIGCCDSSKNKHATEHFRKTGHPIMRSFEAGETWGWCYVDKVELDFA